MTATAKRSPSSVTDAFELHRFLARFNRRRLRPEFIASDWQSALRIETSSRLREGAFVEAERAFVAAEATRAPWQPEAFMRWFNELRHCGPGQSDPLFPWLAAQADRTAMRWFLAQEVAGEAGFEDLVALTQVNLPARPKLEMARNFWDEMGRGQARGMHGSMLQRISEAFALEPEIDTTVWESLALSNLMVALAANRRYAYQSIGALGVIEMTAPGRVSKVNEGLLRLGVPARTRSYFQVHASLDRAHSEAWNREVIAPLVAADPRTARPIAEGALMRLNAGARCFKRYREQLMPAVHGYAGFPANGNAASGACQKFCVQEAIA